MDIEKYAAFQLPDFLEDDFFLQWATHPDVNARQFWKSFLQAYPNKEEIVNKAVNIIRMYREQDFLGNETNKQQVWQRITGSVEKPVSIKKGRISLLPVFVRVAAIFIIVAGLAFWFINRATGKKMLLVSTTAGQIKTITLPDHSTVTLNGNSTLTYNGTWEDNVPREVWIKGEGYFDVKHLNGDSLHIKPSERFIVHCADLNIEVLGTTFNVKVRSGKTNVALLTGSIRIGYNEGDAVSPRPLIMAPGDYVEYGGKKLLVTKKLVTPARVVSWVSDEISFSNATLQEITETLRDRFGYTVKMEDPGLLQQKIEGDITVTNVADLLDVITTTLNIKIEQSANRHITISR